MSKRVTGVCRLHIRKRNSITNLSRSGRLDTQLRCTSRQRPYDANSSELFAEIQLPVQSLARMHCQIELERMSTERGRIACQRAVAELLFHEPLPRCSTGQMSGGSKW